MLLRENFDVLWSFTRQSLSECGLETAYIGMQYMPGNNSGPTLGE